MTEKPPFYNKDIKMAMGVEDEDGKLEEKALKIFEEASNGRAFTVSGGDFNPNNRMQGRVVDKLRLHAVVEYRLDSNEDKWYKATETYANPVRRGLEWEDSAN